MESTTVQRIIATLKHAGTPLDVYGIWVVGCFDNGIYVADLSPVLDRMVQSGMLRQIGSDSYRQYALVSE